MELHGLGQKPEQVHVRAAREFLETSFGGRSIEGTEKVLSNLRPEDQKTIQTMIQVLQNPKAPPQSYDNVSFKSLHGRIQTLQNTQNLLKRQAASGCMSCFKRVFTPEQLREGIVDSGIVLDGAHQMARPMVSDLLVPADQADAQLQIGDDVALEDKLKELGRKSKEVRQTTAFKSSFSMVRKEVEALQSNSAHMLPSTLRDRMLELHDTLEQLVVMDMALAKGGVNLKFNAGPDVDISIIQDAIKEYEKAAKREGQVTVTVNSATAGDDVTIASFRAKRRGSEASASQRGGAGSARARSLTVSSGSVAPTQAPPAAPSGAGVGGTDNNNNNNNNVERTNISASPNKPPAAPPPKAPLRPIKATEAPVGASIPGPKFTPQQAMNKFAGVVQEISTRIATDRTLHTPASARRAGPAGLNFNPSGINDVKKLHKTMHSSLADSKAETAKREQKILEKYEGHGKTLDEIKAYLEPRKTTNFSSVSDTRPIAVADSLEIEEIQKRQRTNAEDTATLRAAFAGLGEELKNLNNGQDPGFDLDPDPNRLLTDLQ